jgi:hypothetical protein
MPKPQMSAEGGDIYISQKEDSSLLLPGASGFSSMFSVHHVLVQLKRRTVGATWRRSARWMAEQDIRW